MSKAGPVKPAVAVKEGTKYLPVDLTEAEIAIRGRELAGMGERIDELEAEAKRDAAERRVKLKEARAALAKLQKIVHTCKEDRPVMVEERIDYDEKVARLIRTDTGAVVEVRALTEQELQIPLQFPRRLVAAADGPAPGETVPSSETPRPKRDRSGRKRGGGGSTPTTH